VRSAENYCAEDFVPPVEHNLESTSTLVMRILHDLHTSCKAVEDAVKKAVYGTILDRDGGE